MPHSHAVLRQDVMLSWPSSPIHPSARPSTFVAWPDPVFCGVPNFGRCEGRKPRPSFGMLTLLAYPHEPWFDCALASRLMACWPELERVKNKQGNKTSHLVANGSSLFASPVPPLRSRGSWPKPYISTPYLGYRNELADAVI